MEKRSGRGKAVGGRRWGGGFQVCALLAVEERWKGGGKGIKHLNKGLNMKLAVFGNLIPAGGLVRVSFISFQSWFDDYYLLWWAGLGVMDQKPASRPWQGPGRHEGAEGNILGRKRKDTCSAATPRYVCLCMTEDGEPPGRKDGDLALHYCPPAVVRPVPERRATTGWPDPRWSTSWHHCLRNAAGAKLNRPS